MRRLLATALCLLPLAVAACGGGGGSSSGARSPLDEALGYLPKSAPLAVAVDTNPNDAQWRSLTAHARKFPFAGTIESSLRNAIGAQGLDFEKDLRPLLGNEAVIGAPTVQALMSNKAQVVGALEVRDKGKLTSVLSNSKTLKKDGSSDGATLYRQTSGGGEAAQKGDVLIFSTTKRQLLAALQQRDRADRLTEGAFDSSLSGLPASALVRVYVNAQSLVDGSPASAQARKVKWVSALRTVGLTASSGSNGVALDFDARTDPSRLTGADLPFASGAASPPVASISGEIGVGIRGLDQTVKFAESVAQAVSPVSFGHFVKSKKQIASGLGVDVDRDVIGQFAGNATLALDVSGHFALRAEPKDPAAFAKTLAKLAKVAPAFARGAGFEGARLTTSHGLYRLSGRGGKTLYYGMVGKVFAASNDASRLAQAAAQSPQGVPGAQGAVSIQADAGKLVADIVKQAAGGGIGGAFGGAFFSAPLGDLTGWTQATTSGIRGQLKLEIK